MIVNNGKKYSQKLSFSVKLDKMLAVSKTANIFTETLNFLEQRGDQKTTACVVLDWFAVMVYTSFGAPEDDKKLYPLNDVVVLEYTESSAGMFKYNYKVHWYGAHVANLLCCTKGKLIPDGVAKLEMLNFMLYSFEWKNAYKDIMHSINGQFKNVTRLDIAIDGVNWLLPFLNDYVKQTQANKVVVKKGKAFLNSKILNEKTMQYRSFLVGAGQSPKKIVIYNKSSELERSNKKYIESIWKKAGIDIKSDVCRVEMRLNSEGVKVIKDFDVNMLDDPQYLLSIFRTHSANFFEFTIQEADSNHSRQKLIDILAFDQLKVPLLEKGQRSVNDGRYKVKLSIHNHVKDIFMNRYSDDEVEQVLNIIDADMATYNLRQYFTNKLPEWVQSYFMTQPEAQRNEYRRDLVYALAYETA